jgi:hypothetical protein
MYAFVAAFAKRCSGGNVSWYFASLRHVHFAALHCVAISLKHIGPETGMSGLFSFFCRLTAHDRRKMWTKRGGGSQNRLTTHCAQ